VGDHPGHVPGGDCVLARIVSQASGSQHRNDHYVRLHDYRRLLHRPLLPASRDHDVGGGVRGSSAKRRDALQ